MNPICIALDISRGSFSLFFSLMSITGALINPFMGQYVGKHGVGGVLLLGRQKRPTFASGKGAVGLGMTRAEALKSPKLYLMMVVIFIITACCGVQQQLPAMLASNGIEAGTVSLMISVMTACLAIGKVARGILYGRLGVKIGGIAMMVVFALGMLTMLVDKLAWPGLILLAFGLGVYTTLLPQVARRIFGSREYASIWALIATAGSAGTFCANPLWGAIYDVTGSYSLALVGGMRRAVGSGCVCHADGSERSLRKVVGAGQCPARRPQGRIHCERLKETAGGNFHRRCFFLLT